MHGPASAPSLLVHIRCPSRRAPKAAGTSPLRRMKVFVSYAHDDAKPFAMVLRLMEQSVERLGGEIWTDQQLLAGDNFDTEIKEKIAAADIAVLALSASFFLPGYIMETEVPAIKARGAAAKHFKLVPVLLNKCMWEEFSKDIGDGLHIIPLDANRRPKPLNTWSPRNHGHHAIQQEIHKTFQAQKAILSAGATP